MEITIYCNPTIFKLDRYRFTAHHTENSVSTFGDVDLETCHFTQ